MTTTFTATATTKPADRLLRTALKVDAVVSAITGLGFVALGRLHDDLYGLPTSWTMPLGIFLLAFGGALWFIGSRPQINPVAVWTIVVGNLAWVVASVLVIVAGLTDLTPLGVGFVALQAAAVALFADLEAIGVRRARR